MSQERRGSNLKGREGDWRDLDAIHHLTCQEERSDHIQPLLTHCMALYSHLARTRAAAHPTEAETRNVHQACAIGIGVHWYSTITYSGQPLASATVAP